MTAIKEEPCMDSDGESESLLAPCDIKKENYVAPEMVAVTESRAEKVKEEPHSDAEESDSDSGSEDSDMQDVLQKPETKVFMENVKVELHSDTEECAESSPCIKTEVCDGVTVKKSLIEEPDPLSHSGGSLAVHTDETADEEEFIIPTSVPEDSNEREEMQMENILLENIECSVPIKMDDAVREHKREFEHSYVCNTCNRTFRFQTELKKHELDHIDEKNSHLDEEKQELDHIHEANSQLDETKQELDHIDEENSQLDETKHELDHIHEENSQLDETKHELDHIHEENSQLDETKHELDHIDEGKVRVNEKSEVQDIEHSFACDVCCTMFKQKKDLVQHRVIHSGEQLFVCDICNKTFSRNHHLYQHVLTHSGERTFVCNICNKTFRLNMSAWSPNQ